MSYSLEEVLLRVSSISLWFYVFRSMSLYNIISATCRPQISPDETYTAEMFCLAESPDSYFTRVFSPYGLAHFLKPDLHSMDMVVRSGCV